MTYSITPPESSFTAYSIASAVNFNALITIDSRPVTVYSVSSLASLHSTLSLTSVASVKRSFTVSKPFPSSFHYIKTSTIASHIHCHCNTNSIHCSLCFIGNKSYHTSFYKSAAIPSRAYLILSTMCSSNSKYSHSASC